MSGEEVTPASVTTATKAILPRLGVESQDMEPARLLMEDEAGFIGAILHADLGIRQDSLAQMLQCSQSKVSRSSNDWEAREAHDNTASA